MPNPNSSDIDAAVIAVLLNDSTLASLLPDGVFFDVAGDGAQRFILVSLLAHNDEDTFGGRTIEEALYLVKAVTLSTSGTDMNLAARRIDALLDNVPLVVTGYTWMDTRRQERLRITEVDPDDPRKRWQHRGGHYRVRMSIS